VAEDLLDADRVAEAGAAWGQVATRPPWGGLVLGGARFVEYGVRTTMLIVPGLFRLDLQPLRETLSVRLRELSPYPTQWEANAETWDALRHPGRNDPMEIRGAFDVPGGPLAAEVRMVMVADHEAGGAYVVARAAVGRRNS
jgi:hypothetical protein